MKLALIFALALALPASAKLGETQTQALVRLGQPDKREGDKQNGTWTWKKEKLETQIQFTNDRSTVEIYDQNDGFTAPQLGAIIARAGAGPWKQGSLEHTFTNGPLLAVVDGWRLTISAAPKGADLASLPEGPEKDASIQKRISELEAESTEITAQISKEKAAGIQRAVGKIISSYPEGHLVACQGQFEGRILIAGLKGTFIDGTEIRVLVKPSGTFQYRAIDAGVHTIQKVQYLSPFPGNQAVTDK